MEPVIVTRDLTREYDGGVHALRGVDVSVAEGEFVAVTGPRLLLADEPTGALDSASAREVMAVLREAHDERGQTIVLVTHDARVAARADRVLAMRDGAVA